MSTSTIYDVKVKYALDDKASQGVKGIATATDRAAHSAFSLRSALAAIGGVGALKLGKTLLVDFKSEIDQMKIVMTAVMQMQLKMPFEKARLEADTLFKVFQEMAKKSPATTKDFMEMGNAIAPVVAMMGGGPEKLAKLTQGGVLASQAFGERADVVALQFAAEHLAESPEEKSTQASHGRYYLEYCSQADGRLRSSMQLEALAELTAEIDNFRAAWDWAITHGEYALIEQTMRVSGYSMTHGLVPRRTRYSWPSHHRTGNSSRALTT